MSVYFEGSGVTLHHGDCLDVLRTLPDASVDSVVCDPPYGLEFMGKSWDRLGDIGKASHGGFTEAADNFKGMALPKSYNASANVKCQTCGKWKFDHIGRKCECGPDAVWPNVKAQQARAMQEWHLAWATECLRVLKPGGHLLAFGGTRTWHRLACAVEDAGFEIRDSIAWLYGSGFPKSLDVSKAIDKAAGRDAADTADRYAEVFVVTRWLKAQLVERGISSAMVNDHFGASNIAQQWLMLEMGAVKRPRVPRWDQWEELRGWLALPADMDAEVWRLNGNKGQPAPLAFAREAKVYGESHGYARVGLSHGAQKSHAATAQVETMGYATGPGDIPATPDAERWQGWGTALKPAFEPVVVARKPLAGTVASNVLAHGTGALNVDGCRIGDEPLTQHGRSDSPNTSMAGRNYAEPAGRAWSGRWPANVILDEDMARVLDEQSGQSVTSKVTRGASKSGADGATARSGGAMERRDDVPCHGDSGGASRFFYTAKADASERPRVNGTAHPTVKPLALMRWLVRLVTPPGGTVLEPFAGSGTTVEACLLEGFRCIAVEKTDEYLPLILARIHRQRDPVQAIRLAGDDLGLFELGGEGA